MVSSAPGRTPHGQHARLSIMAHLILLIVLGLSAQLRAGEVRSRAQIEADWIRQAVVRPLDATGQQVTTRQDAAGGCDGVINGRYGFHTGLDERPWWQVDLGQVEPVTQVLIYNRADGASERALRLEVQLSEDAQQWHTAYRHDGTAFLGATDAAPLRVVCPPHSAARFVRIQLPGRTHLHLDEIQVFAAGRQGNLALRKAADQSSTSPWSSWDTAGAPQPTEPRTYPARQTIDRGLALADDLQRRGVPVDQPRRALQQLQLQAAHVEDAPRETQRAWYLQAQWIVRQLAFSNPLLDFQDLLLVKRVPGSFTHMSDQYYGWFSRPGGGLYILEDFRSDTPRLRSITDQFPPGSFLRPDISHDGRRVLFAYCRYIEGVSEQPNKLDKRNVPEDAFYHLYEMNLDGSSLRQLTCGKYDDFDGRYLGDDRIVFLSTRRGQAVQCNSDANIKDHAPALSDCYVRCGGGPARPVAVYTLHTMDRQGQQMAQISPFEMFEWTPSVDQHGQILYARWDYVDRHNMPYMSLWSTLPDGTEARAVYGNYTRSPHCIFEARRVPESRKIIFTASGHHAQTGGSLVLLDPQRGCDGEAPLTRLTPEVAFPESEGWPQTYFAHPYPLAEKHYLVSWSSSPLPPGTPRPEWGMAGPENDLGVYLYDAFGNLNLLCRDEQISCMYPLPIRRRPRPPRVASHAEIESAQPTRALVVDVYRGLPLVERGSIKQLRLVGIPAKTHPTMNYPVLGLTRDDPGKFVLGTVPVEADGSAHFLVPPGVAFFLQALDARGMAVQTMRSATYLQPGQTTTCIGCHESRNTAPPATVPLASLRAASRITAGPEGSWPLDYHQLVQGVLDKHCVACHQPGADGASFDLTAGQSYDALVHYGTPSLQDHVLQRYQEGRSTPGRCAAASNPLWSLLDTGHWDVVLEAEDRLKLINWMDTYGQRSGSFDDQQAVQLKQLREACSAILQSH